MDHDHEPLLSFANDMAGLALILTVIGAAVAIVLLVLPLLISPW